MIKAKVLGSGSKGNCVYVNVNGHQCLFDCGLSYKRINAGLNESSLSMDMINTTYITHAHNDHINALKLIRKRHPDIKIFFPAESEFQRIKLTDSYKITAIPADHDVPCFMFRIDDLVDNCSLLYITDTGGIPCEALRHMIPPVDILILEMNCDLTLLADNRIYNDKLKERIFNTHLNNRQASDLLSLIGTDKLKFLVPFHLSLQTNNKNLVMYEAEKALKNISPKCKIILSNQNVPTQMVTVL